MATENVTFTSDEIKSEEWRPVPIEGYSDIYEVSSLGRVRRLVDDCQNKRKKGSFISPSYPGEGIYQQYALCLNRKYNRWLAHRLVLTAFAGEPPTAKHHAAHLDGNPRNNRLSNLCWKTAKENDLDKDRHGTRQNGVKHGMVKLTEDQVMEIRRLRTEGVSGVELAKKYNVTPTAISTIATGKSWSHLPSVGYVRKNPGLRVDLAVFEQAKRLAKAGISAERIAKQLPISRYHAQLAKRSIVYE
jgi:hypothetical protein